MQINTGNSLNKSFFFTAIALFLFACRSETTVPSGILPLNDMKVLMWDVTQVDAYANQFLGRDSAADVKAATNKAYQQAFSLHQVSREQFLESLHYYETHPAKHKLLLDSLMQYANRVRDTGDRKKIARPALIKQ